MKNYFKEMNNLRSNVQMIKELDEHYVPDKPGMVIMKEIYLINEYLHLDSMKSSVDFQNMRDMVVMFYDIKISSCNNEMDILECMDKMSAIVSVIDNKKFNMGFSI